MHREHLAGHLVHRLATAARQIIRRLLAVILLATPAAAAVVIDANPPPSAFEHVWVPGIPPQAPLGAAYDDTALTLPEEINAIGENSFRIDIPAPSGRQFVIGDLAGLPTFLYTYIVYSGDGFALADVQDYTFRFDTTSGTAPSTAQSNITTGSSGFRIELRWTIAEPLSFTGLTFTVNFAGFGPGTFSTSPGSSGFGLVRYAVDDPGPALTLEPVPEPPTPALALCALSLATLRLRKNFPRFPGTS